jgi:hypothetical protein
MIHLVRRLHTEGVSVARLICSVIEMNCHVVLCGYNISEYSNNGIINTMIDAHGYVILEEHFIVYRAPGVGD